MGGLARVNRADLAPLENAALSRARTTLARLAQSDLVNAYNVVKTLMSSAKRENTRLRAAMTILELAAGAPPEADKEGAGGTGSGDKILVIAPPEAIAELQRRARGEAVDAEYVEVEPK